MQNSSEKFLRLITTIVGANQTGKTSVFLSFFETKPLFYWEDITLNYHELCINKHTTLGILDYTQLAQSARHINTKSTAIFILIFNINDYSSFIYLKNEIIQIQNLIGEHKRIGTDYNFLLVANNKPLTVNSTEVSEQEIMELCKQLKCKNFSVTATNLETLHDVYSETMQLANNHAAKILETFLQKQQAKIKEIQEQKHTEIKAKLKPYAYFILNLLINICLIIFVVFTIAWCLYNKSQNTETIYEENSRLRGNFFKFWGDVVENSKPNQGSYTVDELRL